MSSPYSLYSGGPCQRCGAPLTPGKSICERCGYSSATHDTSPESGNFSTPNGGRSGKTLKDWSTPQPASPLTQPSGPNSAYNLPSPYQQPSLAKPFNSGFIPTPYITGQQSAPYITGQQHIPSNGLQNTPPPQLTYQQPSGVIGGTGSYQLRNARGPFPNNPTPAPKNGLSARQLIGILLLLAILLAGGLWEYRYITARDEPSLGTSQQAKPTPTPSTPSLFADSFADNTNAWNLQSVNGQFAVSVGNGALSLENDNNKLLWELLPGNRTYDDFRLAVDAKLAKGSRNNGYGIYFRGKSNNNSDLAMYYRFELYGDGSYALFKGVVDGAGNTSTMKLINYTVDPAIQKQGGSNHIVIVASGSKLRFSVNDQPLTTITDTSYASGTIAFFVSNLQGSPPGAQAVFSKLAIYQA
jgi:hypothetical protein